MDDKGLEALQKQYAQSIPEKVATLRQALDDYKNSKSQESLQNLQYLIHRLAGNSGTYGYHQVSDLCKQLDNTLREKIDGADQTSPDDAWFLFLEEHYTKICEAFQDGPRS